MFNWDISKTRVELGGGGGAIFSSIFSMNIPPWPSILI